MCEFNDFLPQARDFLSRLRANNNRDWFKAHQDEYDAKLRDPALALLAEVAPRLSGITGERVREKLFRPQRDIRFSKDKTPYKDHCHMLWHAPADSAMGYYFGISPEELRIGAGVMGWQKGALDSWRSFADGPEGARIAAEIDRLTGAGCEVSEPDLKRVPPPYAGDHPRGDLLRRKSLTVWRDGDWRETDLPGALCAAFADFAPLGALLARV